MSWGMSYDDYWNGDPCMCRFYYQKHILEQKQKNLEQHRMAAYIYDTIQRLQPLLVGFPADDKARPSSFRDDPFPLDEKEAKDQADKRKKEEFEAFRSQMIAFAEANNKKYQTKQTDQTGGKEAWQKPTQK